MRKTAATILLFANILAGPACAGTLSVNVATAAGKPVEDAVVTLRAIGRPTPASPAVNGVKIAQKDIQFRPFVSVVPVGSDVSFPNLDPVRHHVYSFSTAKRFELKLFAKDQTRSVRFEKPGIVAVGCNIHDTMSAFIVVTDSQWTARSDAAGRVSFASLPPGKYMMTVWQPFLRAPGNILSKALTMSSADLRQGVSVNLRPAPMHDMSGY